jgi:secreted trypsin-like serine protease
VDGRTGLQVFQSSNLLSVFNAHSLFRNKITCGGSIIAPKFVLSAAHCIGGDTEKTEIFAGINDINILTEKDPKVTTQIKAIQRRKVVNFYVHPSYNQRHS